MRNLIEKDLVNHLKLLSSMVMSDSEPRSDSNAKLLPLYLLMNVIKKM